MTNPEAEIATLQSRIVALQSRIAAVQKGAKGRYLRRCNTCGDEYTAFRSDSKTCSDRCRQAAKRQRQTGLPK